MLILHTLASGSEGNCLLVSDGATHLLIDAGISTRRIKTSLGQLGLSVDDLAAILITHEHSDHICGLRTLCKHHDVPLYASAPTARQLSYRIAGIDPLLRTVTAEKQFTIGTLTVRVFATSHDSACSVDYRIDSRYGSVGILTDTGYVTESAFSALQGVDLLVLESNHDVEWLRSGPYPYHLKERILSNEGHLSNDTAAAFAVQMAESGTREIVLAHLSRENNTPVRALDTVQLALRAGGYDIPVSVAPRSELSHTYRVEVSVCKR